jgi:hypothetical protein
LNLCGIREIQTADKVLCYQTNPDPCNNARQNKHCERHEPDPFIRLLLGHHRHCRRALDQRAGLRRTAGFIPAAVADPNNSSRDASQSPLEAVFEGHEAARNL